MLVRTYDTNMVSTITQSPLTQKKSNNQKKTEEIDFFSYKNIDVVYYKEILLVKFQNGYQVSTIQSHLRGKTRNKELISSF